MDGWWRLSWFFEKGFFLWMKRRCFSFVFCFDVYLLLTAFGLDNKVFYYNVTAFWRSKSENAFENQVYVAQIVRKIIIAISNIFRRLVFNMAREWWYSIPVASWWLLELTFILLGYFGNVILQFVYFSTWRENGGVQTMFLHGDFSRFSRTLEVNNFVSVDFQTQFSVWFLISMKFCTRVINKKGGG